MYEAYTVFLNGTKRKLIAYRPYQVKELVRFSVANQYLKIRESGNTGLTYSARDYVFAVIRFLNYCMEQLGLEDLENDLPNITFQMAQDYITDYCRKPKTNNGEYRGKQARLNEVKLITRYLINIKSINPNLAECWLKEKNDDTGKTKYQIKPILTSSVPSKEVNRDCEDWFAQLFLDYAYKEDIRVWFIALIQYYTGLRPSEVLNLRHPNSIYGPSIIYSVDLSGNIMDVGIDLSKEAWERPLRDDGVINGRVKKPRNAIISYKSHEIIIDAYLLILGLTRDKERQDYGPLIINNYKNKKTGKHMAYTYDSYRIAFHKIVENYVFPKLREQGGKYEAYVNRFAGKDYGPHMFRHGFSCRFVEEGSEDWATLMALRGDKSPESAVTYVVKGGAFKHITQRLANLTGEEMLGDKKNGRKNGDIGTLPFNL